VSPQRSDFTVDGWRPKGFPVGTRSVHFSPRCARCGILGRGRRSLGHFGGVPPEEITPPMFRNAPRADGGRIQADYVRLISPKK
jgi:hypothetical protein